MSITLSNRARRQLRLTVLGASALISTALASTVELAGGVAGASTSGAEAPRAELSVEVQCPGNGLGLGFWVSYDDLADGHVPQSILEEVSTGSAVVWSRDDLYQENGNYFGLPEFFPDETYDAALTYTYSVRITYDDGVTQTNSTTVNAAADCAATPPTTAPPTTAPTTTAPAPAGDRFVLRTESYGCGAAGGELASLSWRYQDVPDGHYDVRFDFDLMKNSVVIDHETITTGSIANDGLTAFTEYASDRFPGGPLEPASYSLSITITYEDGVTEKHIETFNLASLCDGRVNGASGATAPTTTTPSGSGSLPATGASSMTWAIGALAWLSLAAGALLLTGTGRSRID